MPVKKFGVIPLIAAKLIKIRRDDARGPGFRCAVDTNMKTRETLRRGRLQSGIRSGCDVAPPLANR